MTSTRWCLPTFMVAGIVAGFLCGPAAAAGVRLAILLVLAPVGLVAATLLRSAKFGGQYIEGGACGAVTSTPALIVATRIDETTEPATTYAGIYLFALLASVALSGPKYGYRWQEIEQKGIDIIVALDCSKSMLATDIEPSRLDRAKREVYDLLTMLQGDRVGLVAFAGFAEVVVPPTHDKDQLKDAVENFTTSLGYSF